MNAATRTPGDGALPAGSRRFDRRRLMALVVKESHQALRDPSTLLIAFVLPVVLLLLFAYAVSLDAKQVRVGMAFQNPTMLPWLTVRDNVMMPLKIVPPFRQEYRAKYKTEFRDRADALLKEVGLASFGDKHPWQLSGGMLQRASLCRALVHEPQLLMLDEPFGALDQFTREELWAVMQELWMKLKPTVLLVTHDLKEAGYLANRICVMRTRPGQIIDDAEVPFPRPRTIDMSYLPEFVSMTQRLRELIVSARPVKETVA